MNVVLQLIEVAVEFVWWGGGGVCIVIFMAYLTTVVLGLCYIVLSLGL